MQVNESEKAMVSEFMRLRESLDAPGIRAAVQQGIDDARHNIANASRSESSATAGRRSPASSEAARRCRAST
jgi:hypothetical protein